MITEHENMSKITLFWPAVLLGEKKSAKLSLGATASGPEDVGEHPKAIKLELLTAGRWPTENTHSPSFLVPKTFW